MKLTLRPVTIDDADFLFSLLSERTPKQSISHKTMPTMAHHCAFIASQPYAVWYVIEAGHKIPVGHVYLTKQDEIGIFIKKAFCGQGMGTQAINDLMKLHKRPKYLANIAPTNTQSQNLFHRLGFDLVQFTFQKRVQDA